jgi:hypothetical protein
VDPRARARTGEQLDLTFNMENLHVFDPQTEEAIVT